MIINERLECFLGSPLPSIDSYIDYAGSNIVEVSAETKSKAHTPILGSTLLNTLLIRSVAILLQDLYQLFTFL